MYVASEIRLRLVFDALHGMGFPATGECCIYFIPAAASWNIFAILTRWLGVASARVKSNVPSLLLPVFGVAFRGDV